MSKRGLTPIETRAKLQIATDRLGKGGNVGTNIFGTLLARDITKHNISMYEFMFVSRDEQFGKDTTTPLKGGGSGGQPAERFENNRKVS